MAASHKPIVRRRSHPLRLLVAGVIVASGSVAMIIIQYSHDLYIEAPVTLGGRETGLSTSDLWNGPPARRLLAVVDNKSDTNNVTKQYPPDLFTDSQLKQGAIVLYIIGVMYMFVALAIVCDEFFVPSLEVITQTLTISQDVAGATFMAAGGSAPELFTSFIGVFIAHSDVGIGTIVGSAVFNLLFVIGMCAIFSSQVLILTWWPLFRDVSFYSLSLICLLAFFLDKKIYWWESLVLLCCYALYVTFMKFNMRIERWVKTTCARNRVTNSQPVSSDDLSSTPEPQGCSVEPSGGVTSVPMLKSGSGKFRHGVLQLMIHTIDPISEVENVEDRAVKLHAIASLKVIVNAENHNNPEIVDHNHPKSNAQPITAYGQPITANGQPITAYGQPITAYGQPITANGQPIAANGQPITANGQQLSSTISIIGSDMERHASQQTTMTTAGSGDEYCITNEVDSNRVVSHSITLGNGEAAGPSATANGGLKSAAADSAQDPDKQCTLAMETPEPLNLSWPPTCLKRLTYLIVAPIVLPMWITLPDVRKASSRPWFPVTFIGSIMWIAVFSYLMNWWAATIGRTIGIKDPVMGLTFLAAGTSIPDLITSVIVAKKGYGDMAVSSSVGSNIFDVTVGLPLPWLVNGLIKGTPYSVDSTGLFCSIALLFLMLLLVIIMIAFFKWRMNKAMGVFCLFFYLVFLALSLLLEYDIINCPVNV